CPWALLADDATSCRKLHQPVRCTRQARFREIRSRSLLEWPRSNSSRRRASTKSSRKPHVRYVKNSSAARRLVAFHFPQQVSAGCPASTSAPARPRATPKSCSAIPRHSIVFFTPCSPRASTWLRRHSRRDSCLQRTGRRKSKRRRQLREKPSRTPNPEGP